VNLEYNLLIFHPHPPHTLLAARRMLNTGISRGANNQEWAGGAL